MPVVGVAGQDHGAGEVATAGHATRNGADIEGPARGEACAERTSGVSLRADNHRERRD